MVYTNKKKKHARKGVKPAKPSKSDAYQPSVKKGFFLREKVIIRVSFEGVISLIRQDEDTILECVDDYRRRADGVPTFCETKMGATKLKLSGLWPGGSRDLSSVTPSRIFFPHPASSAFAKYGLVSTSTTREWVSGSVQHVALKDRLIRIKSLEVAEKFREARDATMCDQIRLRTVTRGNVRGINHSGDVDAMMVRCKQMQNSFWALFHARLWFVVNTIGISSVEAYPASLGFTWSLADDDGNPMGEVSIGTAKVPTRLLTARRVILTLAAHLANVVRHVVEHTPCTLRPWQGANVHYADLHEIARPLERMTAYVRTCNLDAYLPNTVEFMRARLVWAKTMKGMGTLHSLFLAAMSATAVTQTMAIESGFVNPSTVPVQQLGERLTVNKQFYGYTIAQSEYCRLVKTNAGPPSHAFMPFNNDAFTCALSSGETPYKYQHPLVFWTSIQYAEMQTHVTPSKATETFNDLSHGVKMHAIASKALLMNSLGPDRSTMRECFAQAIAEENAYRLVDTTKRYTVVDKNGASMVALKVLPFINNEKFNVTEFAQLFVRLLQKNDLVVYLTDSLTLNVRWFSRSKYLRQKLDTPEHNMLRKIVSMQILSDFIARWTYSRRLYRATNAIAVQSIARGWLARMRVGRVRATREMHEDARRRYRRTMQLLVWAQRRAASNFAAKTRAATRIAYYWRAYSVKAEFARTRKASLVLQAWLKARAARTRFTLYVQAARTLQRVYRGHRTRTKCARERQLAAELWAARTLQRLCRGHQTRKRVAKVLVERHRHFQIIHQHKVQKIAEQLRYLFHWDRLVKDQYMAYNSLPCGTIPFPLLLGFPSLDMYLCTIPPPYRVQTLVEACNYVPDVVATPEGVFHMGFTQAQPMVPVVEMVPVVKMVPLRY